MKFILLTEITLQDDDAVNAEAFINKASFLVSNSQNEVLNLQYKVYTFTSDEGYECFWGEGDW